MVARGLSESLGERVKASSENATAPFGKFDGACSVDDSEVKKKLIQRTLLFSPGFQTRMKLSRDPESDWFVQHEFAICRAVDC